MLKKTCLIIILATNFSDLLSTDLSAPRPRRVVGEPPFYYMLEGRQKGDIPIDTSTHSLGTAEERRATIELAHQIKDSVSRGNGDLVIFGRTSQNHGELTISLSLDMKEDRITRSVITGPGFRLSFDMSRDPTYRQSNNCTDPTYRQSNNCKDLMQRLISRNQLSYYTCEVNSSDGSPNIGFLMLLTSAHGIPIPCRSSPDLTLKIPHDIQAELISAHEKCIQAQLRREERWSPSRAAWLGAALRAKPKVSAQSCAGIFSLNPAIPKPGRKPKKHKS